jgi:hypothetical protein
MFAHVQHNFAEDKNEFGLVLIWLLRLRRLQALA